MLVSIFLPFLIELIISNILCLSFKLCDWLVTAKMCWCLNISSFIFLLLKSLDTFQSLLLFYNNDNELASWFYFTCFEFEALTISFCWHFLFSSTGRSIFLVIYRSILPSRYFVLLSLVLTFQKKKKRSD